MLPYFYIPSFQEGQTEIVLDEDNSRHIVQVLRMRPGEPLQLTDGRGSSIRAVIQEDHKKKCRVRVVSAEHSSLARRRVTVAISLVKNASRFEWFLEKATEIGVTGIIPLLCERTERQHFRQDRMQQILVSAMLQSQQVWLPDLSQPLGCEELIKRSKAEFGMRFIAHCVDERPASEEGMEGPGKKVALADVLRQVEGDDTGRGAGDRILLMIGPEGDFSPSEIRMALQHQILAVTLGETRLRTETAGIVGAALLCIR